MIKLKEKDNKDHVDLALFNHFITSADLAKLDANRMCNMELLRIVSEKQQDILEKKKKKHKKKK